MKTYLLTYGDKNFYISKKHLISLANRSNFFDYSISLGPKNLSYEFKKYTNILSKKEVEAIGYGNTIFYLTC